MLLVPAAIEYTAPTTRLRERDLADELAASRVHVREAIVWLEAEGFVQTSPRRGATVAELHLSDVEIEADGATIVVEVPDDAAAILDDFAALAAS